MEVLSDDVFHFEYAPVPGPGVSEPIYVSQMVSENFPSNFNGPSEFVQQIVNVLETKTAVVSIDQGSLCITLFDKIHRYTLTKVCPQVLDKDTKTITLEKRDILNVYGLGEQFWTGGQADGDWVGRTRTPGSKFGNGMNSYYGGATGNAQFPVAFAVGANNYNFGFFLDNIYKQTWNLENQDLFYVSMWGDHVRFFLFTGQNLLHLRNNYFQITGFPLIPPKKVFGVWTGEYNLYYDAAMMLSKLRGLRESNFPFDGIMLDVQYFGGVTTTDSSPMGSLKYSPKFTNDQDPAEVLKALNRLGIGVIPIEESYLAKNDWAHSIMQDKCYLAQKPSFNSKQQCGAPIYFNEQEGDNCWWGQGGMIDWSNLEGALWWHQNKRVPLINVEPNTIVGHWTDLGEPEIYREEAVYKGYTEISGLKNTHGDVHNIYNLLWHKSIYDGYMQSGIANRPFMVSRSGTSGLQRYGAAVWSADIGSNMASLGAQFNVQLHMSFSGIDYYSSDIGGFHRVALDGDANKLYTRWYAASMWIDFPPRAHVENLCNCKQVTPDKIGHVPSNLANTIQRYELVPYYYSLAYRARTFAEPVIPGLAFYYQNDRNTASMGNQKMIGKDIIVGIVATYDETERNVYLPGGSWINYHTNEWFIATSSAQNSSSNGGSWFYSIPVFIGDIFRTPTFVRAGAVIPKMIVDDQVTNVFGDRKDGTPSNTALVIRAYQQPISDISTEFTLYEDDGRTNDYLKGSFRKTTIAYRGTHYFVIYPSEGTYDGAADKRRVIIEYVVRNKMANTVLLNGISLAKHNNRTAFDGAEAGYFNAEHNLILVKSPVLPVSQTKLFEFHLKDIIPLSSVYLKCNVETHLGESAFAVGNIPQLGNGDVEKALPLPPNNYPVWSMWLTGLDSVKYPTVEWQCAKRQIDGTFILQEFTNSVTLNEEGYSGISAGSI